MGQTNSSSFIIENLKTQEKRKYSSLDKFSDWQDFIINLLHDFESLDLMDTTDYEILVRNHEKSHYIFIENHSEDRHDVAMIRIQNKKHLYKRYEYLIKYPKKYQRKLLICD